jgi:hypothetical protein
LPSSAGKTSEPVVLIPAWRPEATDHFFFFPACEPNNNHGILLLRLEKAHRHALENHVHRNPRLGIQVMINKTWYMSMAETNCAKCGKKVYQSGLREKGFEAPIYLCALMAVYLFV